MIIDARVCCHKDHRSLSVLGAVRSALETIKEEGYIIVYSVLDFEGKVVKTDMVRMYISKCAHGQNEKYVTRVKKDGSLLIFRA